ncbi:hypothetical protein GAP227_07 [Cronobacter phage vB_CskP_GAP227]|uniref:Uncharacterized protein n=2 Tax=Cronosvirus TaxID=2732913 RepID=K9RZT3_9CAUD|nr:hypothetical protein GAP227_07 [Cronobacter phage vB_CskP_GAP227]AFY63124.1 hypothetical protein GAP227_07 [Cronobacter phage vB_CskP_GAP227]BET03771.1 hypothetical protein [Cronobacter phage GY3]
MNRVVYSTDAAHPAYRNPLVEAKTESMREWEERPRRTQRECRDAQNALNIEYRRRAAACGMTFEGYLARFNITLK